MEQLVVWIGIAGVVVNLTAYLLLSTGRLRASDAAYQWCNIGGTCAILLSLLAQWNLPSFILNVAWLMIGIVALIRIYRKRQA